MDTQNGGLGVLSVLGIIFIVLKLTGVIAWSWWLVLAPIYIPLVLSFIAIGLGIYVVTRIKKYGKDS